jgi:hypothetical protein
MKKIKSLNLIKNFGLALFLTVSGSGQLFANTFNYSPGDVLICVRQTGSGPEDLVVDAGPISYFTNLSPNTTVTITGYNGQQLGQVGTNGIAWSAWAYFGNTVIPANAQETLFVSKPSIDLNTQSTPYYRDIASAQGQVTSKMNAIIAGAANNANYSVLNTATTVLEPESYNVNNSALSYDLGLGPNTLDFRQTFQAQPEQFTPDDFTDNGASVRADFYWLAPALDLSEPPATFLGYFELSTNGVMTYTAYPSATIATPTIVSYVHNGTTNTLTFTTGGSGTYTLLGSDSLAIPRANWSVIGSVTGDSNNHSLSDVTTGVNKFYVITAQ